MKQTMTIEVEVEDITWSPSREVYVVRYWDDARTLATRYMTVEQLRAHGLEATHGLRLCVPVWNEQLRAHGLEATE